MISFVVPAHNEEELIGRTLTAVHESARAVGEEYEIVVANDSSTDRTGEIAREHGARVIAVDRRQIAATRNAGAREAKGDVLIFVDADTMVTDQALAAAVNALRGGAIGGGCNVRFDGRVPLYGKVFEKWIFPIAFPLFRLAPGCFLFCTRQAYEDVGGFNETMYWAEEVAFCGRLKRQGRFVMLREFVITSARKLRTHSLLQLTWVGIRLAFRRPSAKDFWYGQRSAPQ